MNLHRYSFFGQKTGFIVDSSNWQDPWLFFRFLKKKFDNVWEKPSLKEGKVIKINLLELISIRQLLHDGKGKWAGFHTFGEEKTSITFEFVDDSFNISCSGYQKIMKSAEFILLRELLDHITKEKIEYATSAEASRNLKEEFDFNENISSPSIARPRPDPTPIPKNIDEKSIHSEQPINQIPKDTHIVDENIQSLLYSEKVESSSQNISQNRNESDVAPDKWISNLPKEEGYYLLPGNITARRPKAVAFQFKTGKTIWIPLSTLKDPLADSKIWVKSWFLEKNLNQIFSSS